MTDKVIIYTSPGCPDCAAVKNWLKKNNIQYTEIDITANSNADEAYKKFGVRIAPITVIDDKFFYGTFKDQKPNLEKIFKKS
ncbi:glutaredoxin [Thermodesulfobium narugense DSM 14796]|uniref:Glutaredoxin n=1 Tax=Thermodesulfobium narugense DSM 14796 TaxID=747365 RepID=M1E4E7_9BACT|nr:glutaredoxin family protein [Thermodesulfobium narugense]AEE14077.1 glutaredoxin [Thermodesulfobium narugense DSM 14796]